MRLNHKGRERHQRRVANRAKYKGKVVSKFQIGQEVRINTDVFGASYKGRKGTVVGVEGVLFSVQTPKRKSPLVIEQHYLDAA